MLLEISLHACTHRDGKVEAIVRSPRWLRTSTGTAAYSCWSVPSGVVGTAPFELNVITCVVAAVTDYSAHHWLDVLWFWVLCSHQRLFPLLPKSRLSWLAIHTHEYVLYAWMVIAPWLGDTVILQASQCLPHLTSSFMCRLLFQIECMVATEIMQRYRKLQFEKGKYAPMCHRYVPISKDPKNTACFNPLSDRYISGEDMLYTIYHAHTIFVYSLQVVVWS